MTTISSVGPSQLDQPKVQLAGAAGPEFIASRQKRPEMKANAVSDAASAASAAAPEVKLSEATKPTLESIQAVAEQLQGFLQESGRNLNVYVDQVTGAYVARVVNPETGEVVRQLPPEELLRISRNIDAMLGVLVDRRA